MNNETFLKQLELDYLARFRAMSANELVECFNREVGSRGWTGSRSAYLSALHRAFESLEMQLDPLVFTPSGLSLNIKLTVEGDCICGVE